LFTKFNQKYKAMFDQKHKALFLDPNSPAVKVIDEKINIILSPSLYWVKKLSLPVKYTRDAKKLLPSIFEDSLPQGHYSYSVYKKGDDFFAFAYDDKVIIDTLKEKGIAFSDVASVYFAQSELFFMKGAFKINETQSIYVRDEIVVLLPCCWVEESGELNLDELSLSSHSIALAQFGHIVDNSSLYKIGAVVIALIILVLTEYFITSAKVDELTNLKEELFTKSKLQATMFQNEATLKKYEKVDTRQATLRAYIAMVLSFKLKPSESLVKMGFKNKVFSADFNLLSQQSIAGITKKLKSSKFKFKARSKNETWHLEMEL